MTHPKPEDSKTVTADKLRVGTLVYAASGWLGGGEETQGCWRKVVAIEADGGDKKIDRDLRVRLEKFPGESEHLVKWFDNHTLVIVHKDADV